MATRERPDMEERLQRIEIKVDALDHKVEALDEKVYALDRKVDVLGDKVDALDQKVDRLDHKVHALDQKVDRLDLKMDAQGERIDRLETRMDVQFDVARADVRNVAEGLVALSERMDRGFADIKDDMRADRAFFKTLFVNHEQRITVLEQRP